MSYYLVTEWDDSPDRYGRSVGGASITEFATQELLDTYLSSHTEVTRYAVIHGVWQGSQGGMSLKFGHKSGCSTHRSDGTYDKMSYKVGG